MTTRERVALGAAAAGLLGTAAGCESAGSARSFDSPEEAVVALAEAADARDPEQVDELFGPRVDELRSGDAAQDERDIASFRHALARHAAVEDHGDGTAVVLVGDVRWPFAVPLVEKGGRWRFDTDAGIEELANRRVGRNELRTIEACRTLIDAQEQYFASDRDGDGVREYADRLLSTPGRKDGLYWPSPGGVDPSPIGPVLAEAAVRRDEQGRREPFNGYFYRLLRRQGPAAPGGAGAYSTEAGLTRGWAVIAWPAEYGHTGVMSFMASDAGVVYEADLGPETGTVAPAVDEFEPSGGWRPVGR